jgi:hypothetical protein
VRLTFVTVIRKSQGAPAMQASRAADFFTARSAAETLTVGGGGGSGVTVGGVAGSSGCKIMIVLV